MRSDALVLQPLLIVAMGLVVVVMLTVLAVCCPSFR